MSQPSHYPSPEDVETAFYEALVKGDIDGLMGTWAEDEDVVCVHPTGVRIDDINLVRESWRAILASSSLRVEAELVGRWQGTLLAIHHLTETLYLGDNPEGQGTLHVTHVFARGAHGWRLVNRHASPANDEPEPDDVPDPVSHTLH